jgi:starch-binding outer membrane protein, SusD/RagB family
MRRLAILSFVVALGACDSPTVPNYASPNPAVTTQTGLQTLVTGLFGGTRNDLVWIITEETSFARDAGNFTNTDPRFITEFLGDGTPVNNSDFGTFGWNNQFEMMRTADSVVKALPGVVSPTAYTSGQQAQIIGIAKTIKALDLMYLAEQRDTSGVPVGGDALNDLGQPAPILCNKDVWQAIVALLDSGNAELNIDQTDPLAITLPTGFSAVSSVAGPSTAAGSFAAFNRALAGKANLELAYAIARNSAGTAPTPTTAGTPDHTALVRADSAIQASWLYQPGDLAPAATGAFSDPVAVYHSFSGTSGDLQNPINGEIGTLRVLNEFVASVDTANDLRWKAKFIVNSAAPQQQAYSAAVASDWIVDFYPGVASPIPIVRNEELVLIRAQIRLGLGDLSTAWNLINTVRTNVGGLVAETPSNDYVTTRDALMSEQRISTVLEGGGDRAIAIRMYGLPTVADTTWGSNDTHATLMPIPVAELAGRASATPSCP